MKNSSYLDRLEGYTLPLVICTLEKIDEPAAIMKVACQNQRGPLRVQLAAELSTMAAALLRVNLTAGRWQSELESQIDILGGEDLRELKRSLDLARNRKSQALSRITEFEQMIHRIGFGTLKASRRDEGNPHASPNYVFIAWEKEDEVFWAKKRYDVLLVSFVKLDSEVQDLEQRYCSNRNSIINESTFSTTFTERLKKRDLIPPSGTSDEHLCHSICIDFDAQYLEIQDGAAYLLSKNDRTWWKAFVARIHGEVEKKSRAGYAQVMMRDPHLAACVRGMLRSKTLGGAWIDVLRDPAANFGRMNWPGYTGPGGSLTQNAITQIMKTLKEEDRRAVAWIREQAGPYHPADFYRRRQDGATASLQGASSTHAMREYSPERAANELHWCLSGADESLFSPALSTAYSQERWLSWVQGAKAGFPDYWVGIVK